MKDIYFEDIHKASGHYPYLDFKMENINYISHLHEEIELVYVRSGEVDIKTDSQAKTLVCGDICFFMPCEIHSFMSHKPNQLYIMKFFSKSYMEDLDFAFIRLLDNVVISSHPYYHELLLDIQKIAQEATEKKVGYEFAVHTHTNHILLVIARHLAYSNIDMAYKKLLTARLVFLKSVNEYINIHYGDAISLDQIANHCNLSKYYFAHFFRKVTNMSFLDYLTMVRLEKALELITMSSDSMTAISERCGFSNTRSFNRMFKKHFGATPSAYKNNQKNK